MPAAKKKGKNAAEAAPAPVAAANPNDLPALPPDAPRVKLPVLLEVELYENQRRFPLSGWGSKRLPTDRASWSSRDGVMERTKQEIEAELPAVYRWTSEWEVDKRPGATDNDGWSYAFDFPMQYHNTSSFNRHVRRRRWVRRAERPDTGSLSERVPLKFARHSMVAVTDPDFDDVEVAEVQHLERQRGLSVGPTPQWQEDSSVRSCPRCNVEFGLLKRRHHCRSCGKIYCDACCPVSAEHSHIRICTPCVEAEAERVERERQEEREKRERERLEREARLKFEAAVASMIEDERVVRADFEKQRDEQLERLQMILSVEGSKVVAAREEQLRREREAQENNSKASIRDVWAAIKGKRAGSLTITVVRAQGLVPRRPFMSCDSQPIITNTSTGKEYKGPIVRWSVDPEYDFEEYFAVEDDTKPILIRVMEWRTGGSICIGKLDLRFRYPNLVREVSDEGVFTEFGHVQMDVYDSWSHVFPSTTLTIKWKFEARTQPPSGFCDDCGKLQHLCICDEETINIRRQREQLKEMQRQAAIDEARMEREAKEREEREKREKAEAEWRRKELCRLLDGNDFAERKARREIEEQQTQKRLCLLDQRQGGASQIRKRELKDTMLRNALRDIFRMSASHERALIGRCFALWFECIVRRQARKRDEAERQRVLDEQSRQLTAVEAERAKLEKEALERKKQEEGQAKMDAYNDGFNDLNDVERGNDGAPRPVEHRAADRDRRVNVDNRGCCCVAM